jgi:glycine C-acetyltransferase
LPEIVALCRRHGARLLVDEAHSAFIFGAEGRGVVEHFGVEDGVDVHVGTLSKSLGGMGGYVAGAAALIDYVRSYARARTFSCALAPPVVGGLLAALRVLRAEPELRRRLWHNVGVMREALVDRGVDIGATASQVIPVLVGDDDRIFDITRSLLRRGIYLNPIRYPAVKKHHARFRISISAAHDPIELRRAAAIIGDVLAQHGSAGLRP